MEEMLGNGACNAAPPNGRDWSYSLSSELLQEIARRVDASSWAALRCVCRNWRRGISLAVQTVHLTVPDRSTAMIVHVPLTGALPAENARRAVRRGGPPGRPACRAAASPNHEPPRARTGEPDAAPGAGPSAVQPCTTVFKPPPSPRIPGLQPPQQQPQQQWPTAAAGPGYARSSGRPPGGVPNVSDALRSGTCVGPVTAAAAAAAAALAGSGERTAGGEEPSGGIPPLPPPPAPAAGAPGLAHGGLCGLGVPELDPLAFVLYPAYGQCSMAVAAVAAAAAARKHQQQLLHQQRHHHQQQQFHLQGGNGGGSGAPSDSYAAGVASSVGSSSIVVWNFLEAADKLAAAFPAYVNLNLDFTEPLPVAELGPGDLGMGGGHYLQLEISAALQQLMTDRLLSLTLSGHTLYPLLLVPPPSLPPPPPVLPSPLRPHQHNHPHHLHHSPHQQHQQQQQEQQQEPQHQHPHQHHRLQRASSRPAHGTDADADAGFPLRLCTANATPAAAAAAEGCGGSPSAAGALRTSSDPVLGDGQTRGSSRPRKHPKTQPHQSPQTVSLIARAGQHREQTGHVARRSSPTWRQQLLVDGRLYGTGGGAVAARGGFTVADALEALVERDPSAAEVEMHDANGRDGCYNDSADVDPQQPDRRHRCWWGPSEVLSAEAAATATSPQNPVPLEPRSPRADPTVVARQPASSGSAPSHGSPGVHGGGEGVVNEGQDQLVLELVGLLEANGSGGGGDGSNGDSEQRFGGADGSERGGSRRDGLNAAGHKLRPCAAGGKETLCRTAADRRHECASVYCQPPCGAARGRTEHEGGSAGLGSQGADGGGDGSMGGQGSHPGSAGDGCGGCDGTVAAEAVVAADPHAGDPHAGDAGTATVQAGSQSHGSSGKGCTADATAAVTATAGQNVQMIGKGEPASAAAAGRTTTRSGAPAGSIAAPVHKSASTPPSQPPVITTHAGATGTQTAAANGGGAWGCSTAAAAAAAATAGDLNLPAAATAGDLNLPAAATVADLNLPAAATVADLNLPAAATVGDLNLPAAATAGDLNLPGAPPLLSRLSQLQSLTLVCDLGFPSPLHLEALTALHDLRTLDMRGAKFMQVTEGEVSLVARSARIHVSNDHVAVLARCSPRLTSLSINHLQLVSGQQLAALTALSGLTALRLTDALSGNTVHGVHLQALAAGLTGLKLLDIGRVTCPPMGFLQPPPLAPLAPLAPQAAAEPPGGLNPTTATAAGTAVTATGTGTSTANAGTGTGLGALTASLGVSGQHHASAAPVPAPGIPGCPPTAPMAAGGHGATGDCLLPARPPASGVAAGGDGPPAAGSWGEQPWQPWGSVLGAFQGLTSLHLQVACTFETQLLYGVAALPLLENLSLEILDVPPPQLTALLHVLSSPTVTDPWVAGDSGGGVSGHETSGYTDSHVPHSKDWHHRRSGGGGGVNSSGGVPAHAGMGAKHAHDALPSAYADARGVHGGGSSTRAGGLSLVLHSLTLTACMLYDDHLLLMGRLRNLRSIHLDQVDIRTRDPDGWTALSPVRSLEVFSFREWNNPVLSAASLCVLTNDSLAMMAANWPRLRQLAYSGKVALTEKAEEHLAHMTCLNTAEITGANGTSCRVWRSAATGQLLRTLTLPHTAAKVSSRNGYVTYSDSDDASKSDGSEASVNWMGEMGYVTSEYDAD